MNQIIIPDNWYHLTEEEQKQCITYLMQNYKSFTLDCTPYNRENNTGLDVTISGPGFKVCIGKLLSPKYKRGGRATMGWVSYSGDYGYSYDGYNINGISVFIDQKHEHWPDMYPIQDPLYKKVHELYLSVRAETIPTYSQQKQIEKQQAEKKFEQDAQLALLQTMRAQGAISDVIYNEWAGKIK
ncbi:MAG: hypothetical protein J6T57_01070 [Alphaproteobacteria bacterium]|nr:hypothetical protein [Alphaproteobacteria bacterium]